MLESTKYDFLGKPGSKISEVITRSRNDAQPTVVVRVGDVVRLQGHGLFGFKVVDVNIHLITLQSFKGGQYYMPTQRFLSGYDATKKVWINDD